MTNYSETNRETTIPTKHIILKSSTPAFIWCWLVDQRLRTVLGMNPECPAVTESNTLPEVSMSSFMLVPLVDGAQCY